MNAPFSRLHRPSSAPASSQFAPTLPMEAMHELAALDETGWQEAPLQEDAGPPPGLLHPLASATGDSGPEGAFHEPLGGLQMRELASPELFEHLFGSVEPR